MTGPRLVALRASVYLASCVLCTVIYLDVLTRHRSSTFATSQNFFYRKQLLSKIAAMEFENDKRSEFLSEQPVEKQLGVT